MGLARTLSNAVLTLQPSEVLKVVLGASKTTNDCPIHVEHTDVNGTDLKTTMTTTNGATAVSVITQGSATSTPRRAVRRITVYNADTVTSTVTVKHNDGTSDYVLTTVSLAAGDTLILDELDTFVLDSSGRRKTVTTQPAEVTAYAASGAIAVPSGPNGVAVLTKAGVGAMTLAAPTAGTDDGKRLTVISATAQAHTLTNSSPGFNGGGSGSDVGTFGGAIGDGIALVAYQGVWLVVSKTNVTLA